MATEMSPDDWMALQHWIRNNTRLFAKGDVENTLLQYLIDRTIPFRKLEEKFRMRHVIRGIAGWWMFPMGMSRQIIHRARVGLQKRNVVAFWRKRRTVDSPMFFYPNALGMVQVFASLLEKMLRYDPKAQERSDQLKNIEVKLRGIWEEKDWTVQPISCIDGTRKKIEDSLEQAYGKSRQSKERDFRKKARAPVEKLKPSWIIDLMKQYCDELEVKYFEPTEAKREVHQLFGSARNFLSYCLRDGHDPRDLIHDVCRLWYRFRDRLEWEDGRSILLPESVSFTDFFKYRRQILSWIAAHKDEPNESRVRVVDLGDETERRQREPERKKEENMFNGIFRPNR